jgi:rhodanese-related sulfurtransferase
MNRRRFLATAAGTGAVAIAGCLGNDGYETLPMAGESVPLAPTADAYDWYQNEDLVVLDARQKVAWEYTRIEGALWSPAPSGQASEDPATELGQEQRILTYCGCPHHLSSQRAASLISDGYEEVYALDKGINDWIEQGHPIAGQNAGSLPTYEIRGRTDPDTAGQEVWVREPQTKQREVATIGADGEYAVSFHFVEITEQTPLVLETPEYQLQAPLGTLTGTVVTGALG